MTGVLTVRSSVVVLVAIRTPAGSKQVRYPFCTTASALKGRNMLTRGTSVVIDIHNTSPARPLQIEYPAVLKKTVCFWGAKYNPSLSPSGPRNGSKGGKMGGRRAAWGVMRLPGFHIRFVCGRGGRLGGSRATGLALKSLGHARSFPCCGNSSSTQPAPRQSLP